MSMSQPYRDGVILSQTSQWVTGVEGVVHRTRQRERRVIEESQVDTLTGLQNQNQWVMARPRIDLDQTLWVLRVDVDRFKEINDTHGHAAGDSHLQLVADTLQRSCDTVGISQRMRFRSGGDEFTVVGDHSQLLSVIADLRDSINELLAGGPGTVSTGLGQMDSLADSDMYSHKERTRYSTYRDTET